MPDTTASPEFLGLCRHCDYILTPAQSGRCPECGYAFDPADPSTLNLGKPMPGWAHALLSIPELPRRARALVGFLVLAPIVWLGSTPGLHYHFLLVALAVSLPVVTGFAIFGAVDFARARGARSFRQPRPPSLWRNPKTRWIRWGIPLFALAAVLRVWLFLGCLISLPQLYLLRSQAERTPNIPAYGVAPSALVRGWAGWHRIVGVCKVDGGWMFFTDGGAGFAYYPGNDLASQYNSGNEGRLLGDWWWFSDD